MFEILGGLAMSLFFFIVDVHHYRTDDETSQASLGVCLLCHISLRAWNLNDAFVLMFM